MKSIDTLLRQSKNKTLLVVFPHPDDETVMASGIIQRALEYHWRVIVVSLTFGEAGRLHVYGNGKSLTQIRGDEFDEATKHLGVAETVLWNSGDGKLSTTKKWRSRLESLIKDVKPGIVVAYDHSGISGHPDHIASSLEIFSMIKHQRKITLLWPSFVGVAYNKMVTMDVRKYANKPTHKLTLSLLERFRKWRAAKAYASQDLGGNVPVPLLLLSLVFKDEYYAQADLTKMYSYIYPPFDLGTYQERELKGKEENYETV